MKNLDIHNMMLGDRTLLSKTFEEQGYLYFRDVLDKEAIEEVRRKYFSILVDGYGVVDSGQERPIWNGKDISDFPETIPELEGTGFYEQFASHPKINAFFEDVIGEPITWLPNAEYRLKPPSSSVPKDMFAGRHQDGISNPGYTFLTCWIPIAEIDESIGGLAIAPGAHKKGNHHNLDDPLMLIPDGAITEEEWARPDVYRPGDVLMFGPMTPHSGLSNQSDTFRLSIDIRLSRASDPQPVIGELVDVTKDLITVETTNGQVTIDVTDDTYLRLGNRIPQPIEEIESICSRGDLVLVTEQNGSAVMVRHQKI